MKLDLEVGQTASRTQTITSEPARLYTEISGDRNPLHYDEAFVAGTQFVRLVVQGGITAAALHALVAEDMPGPGTVFLSQDWKFTTLVFIEDTITGSAEVLRVHDSKPVCHLRVEVTREEGEPVLEREGWCYRFSSTEGQVQT
jgi:acyl dehydratase